MDAEAAGRWIPLRADLGDLSHSFVPLNIQNDGAAGDSKKVQRGFRLWLNQ